MTPPTRHDFLGLPLDAVRVDAFIKSVAAGESEEDRPRRVSYLNAHTTNLAFRDETHRAALRRCDLVYADGMGVVWGARWRGAMVPERVNAGDFLPRLLREVVARGRRVALIGGRPGEAERAAERLAPLAEGFRPCYAHHGFLDAADEERIAAELAAARPDLVLIGMGSPRQEVFMHRLADRPEFAATTIWCVGALFEYFAGTRWRAPVWMRRAGLEWLVRLVLEPRRMWRRYLVGNVAFVWRVVRGRPAPPSAA